MGWIEDLSKERVFNYTCGDEIISGTLEGLSATTGQEVKGEPGETISCDGLVYEYAGFEPAHVSTMSMVMFEKNGRKAYRIKDPSGKVRYIAKSKHEYLKHGYIDGKKVQKRGKVTPLKGEPT